MESSENRIQNLSLLAVLFSYTKHEFPGVSAQRTLPNVDVKPGPNITLPVLQIQARDLVSQSSKRVGYIHQERRKLLINMLILRQCFTSNIMISKTSLHLDNYTMQSLGIRDKQYAFLEYHEYNEPFQGEVPVPRRRIWRSRWCHLSIRTKIVSVEGKQVGGNYWRLHFFSNSIWYSLVLSLNSWAKLPEIGAWKAFSPQNLNLPFQKESTGGPGILSKGDRRSLRYVFHKSQIARHAAAVEIKFGRAMSSLVHKDRRRYIWSSFIIYITVVMQCRELIG